eukprot:gene10759-7487_t
MSQNAARLNRLQIREQEQLNRARRLQDEAEEQRQQQRVQYTKQKFRHVQSTAANGFSTTPRSEAVGGVSSFAGDDAQVRVFIRECDAGNARQFVYRESEALMGTGEGAADLPPPRNAPRRGPGPGSSPKQPGGAAVPSYSLAQVRDPERQPDMPNLGRVPRYLQQRKAELAEVKRSKAEEEGRRKELANVPPGHRLVPEDEKAAVLAQLNEREKELDLQLRKIPVRFDTQNIRLKRKAIEDEMDQIEQTRSNLCPTQLEGARLSIDNMHICTLLYKQVPICAAELLAEVPPSTSVLRWFLRGDQSARYPPCIAMLVPAPTHDGGVPNYYHSGTHIFTRWPAWRLEAGSSFQRSAFLNWYRTLLCLLPVGGAPRPNVLSRGTLTPDTLLWLSLSLERSGAALPRPQVGANLLLLLLPSFLFSDPRPWHTFSPRRLLMPDRIAEDSRSRSRSRRRQPLRLPDRLSCMSHLVRQMNAVNLKSLYTETRRIQTRLLRGDQHRARLPTVAEDEESEAAAMDLRRDTELLEHMLCYQQFFLECATAFLHHAEATSRETGAGPIPSPTPAPDGPRSAPPAAEGLLDTIAAAVAAQPCSDPPLPTCVTLTPGVYRESLLLQPSADRPARSAAVALELAAGPAPGAAVLLYRRFPQQPILHVRGEGCTVRLRGLVFIDDGCAELVEGGEWRPGSGGPTRPMLCCTDGATVDCEACHFYGSPHPRTGEALGASGLARALLRCDGAGSHVLLRLCLFSYCHQSGQDGAEVGDGGVLTLEETRVRHCATGLHVLTGGTLRLRDTTVERCTTAGIIVEKAGRISLRRCAVVEQLQHRSAAGVSGRGVWLRSGAQAELADTTVELNGRCGIEYESGAFLRLQRSVVRRNTANVVPTAASASAAKIGHSRLPPSQSGCGWKKIKSNIVAAWAAPLRPRPESSSTQPQLVPAGIPPPSPEKPFTFLFPSPPNFYYIYIYITIYIFGNKSLYLCPVLDASYLLLPRRADRHHPPRLTAVPPPLPRPTSALLDTMIDVDDFLELETSHSSPASALPSPFPSSKPCAGAAELALPESLRHRLFPHQERGIQWLYHRHRTSRAALLADEMGLGKTVQVCSFLGLLYAMGLARTAVLVVPVTLLSLWTDTLRVWGGPSINAPGVVVVLHGSTKGKRAERWRRITFGTPCVVLTSYGVLRQDSASPALSTTVLDYLVLDEAHSIRDGSSSAFKSVMQLSARHRVALTGTPVMNSFADMWSLFQFLDGAALTAVSSSRAAFAAISRTILRGNELDADNKEQAVAARELAKVQEMMRPFTLRREKAEVWPEITSSECGKGLCCSKQDVVVWVALTAVQQQQYESVLELKAASTTSTGRSDTDLSLDDAAGALDDEALLLDGTPSTPAPLALLSLLRDTCQHPWLHLNEAAFHQAIQHLHTAPRGELGDVFSGAKVPLALALLRQQIAEGHKCLVFSRSKRVLLLLSLVLGEAGVGCVRLDGETKADQRAEVVQQFNASSDTYVCLLSTQVGGIGLTFQGASCVLLLDPSWNPAVDNQAVDRVHRIGQTRDVHVFRLVTCGTVEEKIYRNQIFKQTAARQSDAGAGAGAGAGAAPRYFTRLQLRDMFTRGDLSSSETAEQLDTLLAEQQRHSGSSWAPRGVPPALREGLLQLPHVVDVSSNAADLLFGAPQGAAPPPGVPPTTSRACRSEEEPVACGQKRRRESHSRSPERASGEAALRPLADINQMNGTPSMKRDAPPSLYTFSYAGAAVVDLWRGVRNAVDFKVWSNTSLFYLSSLCAFDTPVHRRHSLALPFSYTYIPPPTTPFPQHTKRDGSTMYPRAIPAPPRCSLVFSFLPPHLLPPSFTNNPFASFAPTALRHKKIGPARHPLFLVPMALKVLSYAAGVVFQFSGGYTTMHFLRSPDVFDPRRKADAEWLNSLGGPISGGFARRNGEVPTLSHHVGRAIVEHQFASTLALIFLVLKGGGLPAILGVGTSLLLDGPSGQRYFRAHMLNGGLVGLPLRDPVVSPRTTSLMAIAFSPWHSPYPYGGGGGGEDSSSRRGDIVKQCAKTSEDGVPYDGTATDSRGAKENTTENVPLPLPLTTTTTLYGLPEKLVCGPSMRRLTDSSLPSYFSSHPTMSQTSDDPGDSGGDHLEEAATGPQAWAVLGDGSGAVDTTASLPEEPPATAARAKKKRGKGAVLHPCVAQHGRCQYGEFCKLKDLPGNTCIHHYHGLCAHGDQCRLRHAINGVDIRKLTGVAVAREGEGLLVADRGTFRVTQKRGKVLTACREDECEAPSAPPPPPRDLPAYLRSAPTDTPVPTPYSDLVRGDAMQVGSRLAPVVVRAASSSSQQPSPAPAAVSVGKHPCVARYGSCKFGDACMYADRDGDVCIFFLQGRCRNGDECGYRHETEEAFLQRRHAALLGAAPGSPGSGIHADPVAPLPPRAVDPPAQRSPASEERQDLVLATLCERYPHLQPDGLAEVAGLCSGNLEAALALLAEIAASDEVLSDSRLALALAEEADERHRYDRTAEERSNAVLTLHSLFPDAGFPVILAVLERQHYDITRAYDVLRCSSSHQPERGIGSVGGDKAPVPSAADKIKLQRLTERFPDTAPEMVANVLRAAEGNEKLCVETLNFFIGEKAEVPTSTAATKQGSRRAASNPNYQGIAQTPANRTKTTMPAAPPFKSAAAATAELKSLQKQLRADSSWSTVRSQAYLVNSCRRDLVASATTAYISGNGKAAKAFSAEARQLEVQYTRLNRLAMLLLEELRLRGEVGLLDLHSFHPEEVEEIIYRRCTLCREQHRQRLKIVTGPGLHSRTGKAKLFPYVQDLLSSPPAPLRPFGLRVIHRNGDEGSFVYSLSPSVGSVDTCSPNTKNKNNVEGGHGGWIAIATSSWVLSLSLYISLSIFFVCLFVSGRTNTIFLSGVFVLLVRIKRLIGRCIS